MLRVLLTVLMLLSFSWIASQTPAQDNAPAKKYFIAIFSRGTAWDPSKQANEQIGFQEHSENLRPSRSEKRIPIGGRYSEKGMVIFEAKNEEEARFLFFRPDGGEKDVRSRTSRISTVLQGDDRIAFYFRPPKRKLTMGLALEVGILADLRENDEEGFEYYRGQFADSQGEGATTWERYGIESLSCVCLMQACKKSIESGAAIVFC